MMRNAKLLVQENKVNRFKPVFRVIECRIDCLTYVEIEHGRKEVDIFIHQNSLKNTGLNPFAEPLRNEMMPEAV